MILSYIRFISFSDRDRLFFYHDIWIGTKISNYLTKITNKVCTDFDTVMDWGRTLTTTTVLFIFILYLYRILSITGNQKLVFEFTSFAEPSLSKLYFAGTERVSCHNYICVQIMQNDDNNNMIVSFPHLRSVN